MIQIPLKAGDSASCSKTITAEEIGMFVQMTGDDNPVHIDEEHAKNTTYGKILAHGALVFSLGTTTTTLIQKGNNFEPPALAYGYDHLRFTHPVFIGDTVTATYTVEEVNPENGKVFGKLEIVNQDGKLCVVATGILMFMPDSK